MSLRVYDCPQCGAPVKFQSSIAVSSVCEFCTSLVVCRGAQVETLGLVAQLPPDLSPLQIGTRGQWRDQPFELLGRLRLEWDQGSWTEWYALFAGGQTGWLAEAQGFYMVSFEHADENLPASPSLLHRGLVHQFAGQRWTVSDVKSAKITGAQGELPEGIMPNRPRVSVDLTGTKGGFASIEFPGSGPILYVGNYARFDDLRLTNLRPVPGWSEEVRQVRNQTDALACPQCGGVVEVRAPGQTMAAVCGSCGTLIDTANAAWKILQTAELRLAELRPVLPIGARGLLKGVEYEVMGWVRRRDNYCSWEEYLLFNPWQGFEWLVTYNGHWSFVHRRPEISDLSGNVLNYDGHKFQIYAHGKAHVDAVLGEFYWKVARGEETENTDYICPPHILSRESYPELQEVTWSQGEYLEPSVVAEAFPEPKLPPKHGIYLNEPNPFIERWRSVRWKAWLFLLIYICLQGWFWTTQQTHPIYSGDFEFQRTPDQKVLLTPPFQVNAPQRVEIEARAAVDNSWLGLDMELVNAQTKTTYPADLEISYYHGYDDGAWSEGSRQDSVSIPAVPAGQYQLAIETSADPKILKLPFQIKVSGGGLFWSNFFLGLILLLAYPIYICCRQAYFETLRWSESDYSP